MHVWKGEGDCDYFTAHPPVMEIRSSDVTVRNFGFKGAVYGIRVAGEGLVKNVRLENIEGYSCFKGLTLPKNVEGLTVKDATFVRENRLPQVDE